MPRLKKWKRIRGERMASLNREKKQRKHDDNNTQTVQDVQTHKPNGPNQPKNLQRMGEFAVNEYCTNCAMKFDGESQMYTSIKIGEDNCPGSWEIEVMDAIFYIYGFSARELAIAHLDDYEEDSIESKDKLLETTNYINENRISLCSSCVSVFKTVYTDHVKFRKLSDEDSLLRKAIKRYFPFKNVKVEVKSEESESDNEEFDFSGVDSYYSDDVPIPSSSLELKNERDPAQPLLEPCFVNISDQDIEKVQHYNFDLEQKTDWSDKDDDDCTADPLGNELSANEAAGGDIPGVSIVPLDKRPMTRRTYSLLPPELQMNVKIAKFKLTEEEKVEQLEKLPKNRKPNRFLSEEQRFRMKKKKKKMNWGNNKNIHLKAKLVSIKSKAAEGGTHSRAKEYPTLKKNLANALVKRTLASRVGYKPKSKFTEEEKVNWFTCSCGKRFQTYQSLRRHENNNLHLEESLPCELCGQTFNKMHLLIRHKFRKHSDAHKNLSECDICSKKFLCSVSFQRHLESCHNPMAEYKPQSNFTEEEMANWFTCSCGQRFRVLSSLRLHEDRTLHLDESLPCEICSQTFNKMYLLIQHKFHEHSDAHKNLPECDICGKKFLLRASFKLHAERCRNRSENCKPFICEKCGRSFFCLKYLKKHFITVHTDDGLEKESIKCPQCGINLKNSLGLKKHQRIMHGDQKTFICEQCGKTTKNMTNMRIHMKVHDESRGISRPYKLGATKKNATNMETSVVSDEVLFANI